jgi:hypothetical protein
MWIGGSSYSLIRRFSFQPSTFYFKKIRNENVKEDEITFKNKEKILDFIYKHEKVS